MAAKQCSLYDSFSFEGLWWMSNTPDRKTAGTISFSPEAGAVLSLVGMLRDMQTAFQFGPTAQEQPVAIHGITSDGKQMTLYGCFATNVRLSFPGIPSEQYKARWMLVGANVQSDAEFSGCSLSLSMLEEWLGHRTLQYQFGEQNEGLAIRFVPPTKQELRCESIGSVLSTTWSYRTEGDGIRVFGLHSQSALELKGDTRASLTTWVDRAFRLRNLAAVCYGHPLSLLRLDLLGDAIEIEAGASRTEVINVLFQLPPFARQQFVGKHEQPIISEAELAQSTPEAFQNWFKIYDELEPAMDLFFTVLLNRTLYTDVAFLLASQAVEVLHRLTSTEGIVDEDRFCAVATAISASIPNDTAKELRAKILGLLKYANEPSLRQRLKRSVAMLKEDFGDTPLGLSKKLISDIVNTRNYLTHYSPELANHALTGGDLYYATRRMVALLLVLLLVRIGVPATKLRSSLSRHPEFREFI